MNKKINGDWDWVMIGSSEVTIELRCDNKAQHSSDPRSIYAQVEVRRE